MTPRLLSLLFLLWFNSALAGDRIVQFSTLESLAVGVFDGHFSGQEVLAAGHFGLGTFEAVDGEMVVDKGMMYQVLADGSIVQPDPATIRVPFATVINFEAETTHRLEGLTGVPSLENWIQRETVNANVPYAVRLEGVFERVRTRSPQRQEPPYPSLDVAVASQVVFEGEESRGVMVGFLMPAYLGGLTAPGLHLHYLSDDHAIGGHVLDFQLREGVLGLDSAADFEIRLPVRSAAFRQAALGGNRSIDIEAVEAAR